MLSTDSNSNGYMQWRKCNMNLCYEIKAFATKNVKKLKQLTLEIYINVYSQEILRFSWSQNHSNILMAWQRNRSPECHPVHLQLVLKYGTTTWEV